jgi:hypothetical protein
VEDNGLERPSKSPGKTAFSANAGTKSGTVGDESGTLPPDLAEVVAAWPALSESARAAVLRIVRGQPAEA